LGKQGKFKEMDIFSTQSKKKHITSNVCFELKDASKYFGNICALNSVNLRIDYGEFLFFTGASGAGKTTLLKILLGEAQLDHGQYIKKPFADKFIAPIFQDLKLISDLTGEENIWMAYDPSLYNNKNSFQSDLEQLSRYLGIQDQLHIKIDHANGGLKQKIAILRTLLSKPDIILADEPTCSMDMGSSFKVFEILNYFNTKKQVTIIWASHNRDLVKQFQGKIAHLDKGKLLHTGHACFI